MLSREAPKVPCINSRAAAACPIGLLDTTDLLPVTLMDALLGDPRLTFPVGLDSITLKFLVPVNGLRLLTGIEIFLGAVSPSSQVNCPLFDVKSVPPTAVPLTVVYEIPTFPLEPFVLLTVRMTVP